MLDLPERVVTHVSHELLRRVQPRVEDRVVEVGEVDVVVVLDQRAVEQLHEVPRIVVVLAPADADAEVERFSPVPSAV